MTRKLRVTASVFAGTCARKADSWPLPSKGVSSSGAQTGRSCHKGIVTALITIHAAMPARMCDATRGSRSLPRCSRFHGISHSGQYRRTYGSTAR